MRKTKRFLAVMATIIMAVTPATVFADEITTSPATGGAVSTGGVEGYIDKSVFTVILPTAGSNDATFNFILDPQDLIKDSANAAYSGSTFSGATGLYFETSTNTYTENSADVTIETKTSMPVNVSVDAKVTITSGEGVTFVDDSNVAAATDGALSVYLALTDSVTTPAAVDADGSATLTAEMEALAANSFEVKYEDGAYTYGLTDAAKAADGKKYTFHMTGACNKSGDWTNVKDLDAKVELVWTITAGGSLTATETPIATPGNDAWDGNSIWLDLALGSTVPDQVTISADGGAQVTVTDFDVESGWVGLDFDKASLASYASAGTLSIWIKVGSKVYTCVLW